MDLPHYHNLEWRFDIQLASRALQRQARPSVVFRLHTKDGGTLRVCGNDEGGGSLVTRLLCGSLGKRIGRRVNGKSGP